MSAHVTTFEVRVEVGKRGTERCRPISYCGSERTKSKSLWVFVADKIVKMFHIEARTSEQARRKAKKYGRPISVRKADIASMVGCSENLSLELPPIYDNAVAMDEMIWLKRNNRIKNRTKDKETID